MAERYPSAEREDNLKAGIFKFWNQIAYELKNKNTKVMYQLLKDGIIDEDDVKALTECHTQLKMMDTMMKIVVKRFKCQEFLDVVLKMGYKKIYYDVLGTLPPGDSKTSRSRVPVTEASNDEVQGNMSEEANERVNTTDTNKQLQKAHERFLETAARFEHIMQKQVEMIDKQGENFQNQQREWADKMQTWEKREEAWMKDKEKWEKDRKVQEEKLAKLMELCHDVNRQKEECEDDKCKAEHDHVEAMHEAEKEYANLERKNKVAEERMNEAKRGKEEVVAEQKQLEQQLEEAQADAFELRKKGNVDRGMIDEYKCKIVLLEKKIAMLHQKIKAHEDRQKDVAHHSINTQSLMMKYDRMINRNRVTFAASYELPPILKRKK